MRHGTGWRWGCAALCAAGGLAGCGASGGGGISLDAGPPDRGVIDIGPRDTGIDMQAIFVETEIINSDTPLGELPNDAPADVGRMDTGIRRDAGPAPDAGLGAGETLFGRAPYLCNERSVTPAPGEDGHLAAIQLPPATAPTELFRVVYRTLHQLSPGGDCIGGAAHQFLILASAADTPDATPRVVATVDIPAGPAGAEVDRIVDQVLPTPIAYNPGDRFFAAIRFGAANHTVCIPMCTFQESPSWWSGAASPPYDWAQLATFSVDLSGHLGLWVVGRPRP